MTKMLLEWNNPNGDPQGREDEEDEPFKKP